MSNSTATGNSTQAASGGGFDFKLYRYEPSLPAAVIFVAVFTTLTSLHLWRMARHRTFYFTAFTIGGACE